MFTPCTRTPLTSGLMRSVRVKRENVSESSMILWIHENNNTSTWFAAAARTGMPTDGLLGRRRSSLLSLRAVSAAIIIAGILAGLYFSMVWVQVHIKQYPFLVVLFPPATAAAMAMVIPLLMFISFQDDFRNLSPWNPVHLVAISRRCYSAMAKNNLKVSEKDL